jgi:hypothetical protein
VFERRIEAAVERALDRRAVLPDRRLTLSGYHPLAEIMGALYAWVFVPFRGVEVLVEARFPRSSQLPEVDKLRGLLKGAEGGGALRRKELRELLEIQLACCTAALNRPSFAELEKAITGKDRALEESRRRLEELRERAGEIKREGERRRVQREIDEEELFSGYILPDDTMAALTRIALGLDVSDITKLTEEKLTAAYFKARLYGGRPSDFVAGLFVDEGDRENIDNYATLVGTKKERRPPGGRVPRGPAAMEAGGGG